MTLPLPKREWGEDFLHVHFMPGDKVLLGWSKDFFLRMKISQRGVQDPRSAGCER